MMEVERYDDTYPHNDPALGVSLNDAESGLIDHGPARIRVSQQN